MSKLKKIIIFWGILDLCSISWYVGSRLYEGGVPFYGEITMARNTAQSFGHSLPIILTTIGLVMYATLVPSGILLMKQNKYGAIISYIQTPFRFFLGALPPSLFFIYWPVKYITNIRETPKMTLILIAAILTLSSEIPKLYTVIKWHKNKNSV